MKDKLKFFEIIEMGDIHGGALVNDSCKGTHDCITNDYVWCKKGDSCGKFDAYCGVLQPDSHDGCCTGWWDYKGDSREDYISVL